MRKNCPDCGHELPVGEFYVKARYLDGTPRRWRAYCKRHDLQRAKAWREQNRAWTRADRRARWLAMRTDPEKIGEQRDRDREWHKDKRRAAGIAPRAFRTHGSQRLRSLGETREVVDAAPFRAWLHETREREAWTIAKLETRLGFPEDAMRPIYDGRRRSVDLATVERALIEEGSSMLQDVYPGLYESVAA